MLELNHEYTYQEICRKLGWNVSSGAQKIKQIKVLEESYKFYHPENKKTHKPKKSYIFTEQLKEPVRKMLTKSGSCKESSAELWWNPFISQYEEDAWI